jgi:lysozyme family protein
MSANNFDVCLSFTLKEEGGWADNPIDPGGATQDGITLRTYRLFKHGATVEELRTITQPEVSTIYHRQFWSIMGCDNLPSGIDLMVFDGGVNIGASRAIGYLQIVAGVAQDRIDGPSTEAAVAKLPATDLITRLNVLFMAHYWALPTFGTFGRGWTARSERRVKAAMALVATAGPVVSQSSSEIARVVGHQSGAAFPSPTDDPAHAHQCKSG